jgi:hypothetical protein
VPNRSLWILLSLVAVVAVAAVVERLHTRATLAYTARNFLASLTPEQSSKAVMQFNADERFNWHYIPRPRQGLPLKEMTPAQQHLAHALLSSCLSQSGYTKATTIMSLEDVLRLIEHDNGERRDPQKYYFSIFGEPKEKGVWGVRVEGHHLSLNFTVADGGVSSSPEFLGANPAEVREGPRKGLRVLSGEEDRARALITALSPEQRAQAIVAKTAYKDILTEASRKAALAGQPTGLPVSKMTAAQRELLMDLLGEYVHNVPDDLAGQRLAQIQAAGNNLFFAWAGEIEKGKPHYYRVQAPAFLIEYDDTQNEANHIHSVWRDFDGDFGLDLLKQHYQQAEHDPAHGHTHM